MKIRGLAYIAALLLVTFLVGCTPPYRQTFEDAAKEHHWTHKQMLAAFAAGDRLWWSHELKEGSNQYVIIYGKVPTAKVADQIQQVLTNLDGLLDPNDAGSRQYLDTFGLRKDLEHEEQIGEAQYGRVHGADLQDKFSKIMGDTPSYGSDAAASSGYNIRKIFLAKDPAQAFPFKSDQIEGAKKDGSLKEIESLQLDFNTPYDHKAMDPLHPDDANEFVWKPNHLSIQLTNYKIIVEDKPEDNKGNYIEGYRVVDGKKEDKPALKIFFPENGYGAVVLIDTDRQGEAGYGVPDILTQMGGISNVRDVIANGTLLATLFQEKKQDRRVLPVHNLFKIEIASLDKPIDPWEKSVEDNGWLVPFRYADKDGDNYNIRIKFKKIPIPTDGTDVEHDHMTDYREIEYIAKEWTKSGDIHTASSGAVYEYFKPKGDAAKKCQATVLSDDNTKKIQLEFEDGSQVIGVVTPGSNRFIEDKPYAKSFTEGSVRYWIESSSKDGKYDKRKKTSPPKDQTGYYFEDEDDTYGASDPQPSDFRRNGTKPVLIKPQP